MKMIIKLSTITGGDDRERRTSLDSGIYQKQYINIKNNTMRENKNKILTVLTTKHIETIKTDKLSNICGGDGCVVIIDDGR